MNKFYVFLGHRSGPVFFWKKTFKNQIEAYFISRGIGVKTLDVRQTQGTKYHAFFTLIFKSAQDCYDYYHSIQNSVNKYLVINDEWKIYQFVQKEQRKHDLGFLRHEPDERDEVVGNVFDEDESSVDSSRESSRESSQESSRESSVNSSQESSRESSYDSSDESESEYSLKSQEESSLDDSISIETEEEDTKEYETIYKWLVTPEEEEHQRQIEEIKALCKWLATPYWERT